MVGGFGLVGAPLTLIEALVRERRGARADDHLQQPRRAGQGARARCCSTGGVRRAIGSYFTSNPDVVAAHERGELEVELLPQGTLCGVDPLRRRRARRLLHADRGRDEARRGRARSARSTARATCSSASLRADVALIRARAADELGNLVYDKTARNFNPDMATAGRRRRSPRSTRSSPSGELAPELVATPHLFVDYLVRAEVTL